MGALTSRQNAAVEEADVGSPSAYKYPPKSGNYFGSHFIMGGERFDTPQPEAYLFGENADLNFLGNRPTAFPYPPPQANEPTKTLKSLVNIRKESVRFVKAPDSATKIHGDGTVNKGTSYNIEFVFDSDAKCSITIYYFCTEEMSPGGITYHPRESLSLISETFQYSKGINQYFSQPSHIFNPNLFSEDDLAFNIEKDTYPVALHCIVDEGESRQSHTTICVIDPHADGSYALRALKQKIFVDGLCYLLQEIYGIENKTLNKPTSDDDTDDNGSECVICMSDTRDTLILPCRHLCLCNSCADSLRYQANNCPICRAPFRALLQIRAVQKGISSAPPQQNTPEQNGDNIPPGYTAVSLIEALNGPPQYTGRSGSTDSAENTETDAAHAVEILNIHADKNGKQSPKGSHKRSKSKKVSEVETEFRMSVIKDSAEAENGPATADAKTTSSDLRTEKMNLSNRDKTPARQSSRESLKIVNERHSLKLQQSADQDEDSENEKLSPLLTPSSNTSKKSMIALQMEEEGTEALNGDDDSETQSRPALSADGDGNKLASADDSDCNTTDESQSAKIGKKSTSESALNGLTASTGSTAENTLCSAPVAALKETTSSLPDSPISGNSASVRSSSDSYSSSSSTKQLLSSNKTSLETKVIDEKGTFQNAVSV